MWSDITNHTCVRHSAVCSWPDGVLWAKCLSPRGTSHCHIPLSSIHPPVKSTSNFESEEYQWLEYLPPAPMWPRFKSLRRASYEGWVCCWFSPSPFFGSLIIPNSNSTRNGRRRITMQISYLSRTSKLLFTSYLKMHLEFQRIHCSIKSYFHYSLEAFIWSTVWSILPVQGHPGSASLQAYCRTISNI